MPYIYAQNITTIAGSEFRGDNGPAIDANIYSPSGLAMDSRGNLYIAEPASLAVRKVTANGIITTIAGKSGSNDGVASNTDLKFPTGITVDKYDNIYVADAGNYRIRKIDINGTITTVAGNGYGGFGGDGGAATSAYLNYPTGITIDRNGNLYILDRNNLRVRKVDQNGIITTIAGNGTTGFSGDGGAATQARLSAPSGIVVDDNSNLYIADQGNGRIRKVDRNGIITTVAGNGTTGFSGDGGVATQAGLNNIFGISVDDRGNLYIADVNNHRIRKVGADGIITTVAGSAVGGFGGDGGAATSASLNSPKNMIVDNNGNLYIADSENKRIRKVATNSNIISTVAGNGTDGFGGDGRMATTARLNSPKKVVKARDGSLYISDASNNRIRKIDSNGIITTIAGTGRPNYSGAGGKAANADLVYPSAMTIDNRGNLYVALPVAGRVCKIDTTGLLTTVAGNGMAYGPLKDGVPAIETTLGQPKGVAIDAAGIIYIAEYDYNRIRKIDHNGIISTVVAILGPTAIYVNSDNSLYIGSGQHQIFRVSPTGTTTVIAGTGMGGFSGDGGAAIEATLQNPEDIHIDNQGNIYFTDTGNNRIRKIAPNGTVSTVAGSSFFSGFSGDGGAATNAKLNYPTGVTVDEKGILYIADMFNHRIRQVTLGKLVISAQSGNWSDATTWDCGCVPVKEDVVTISAGHKITVSHPVQTQAIKQEGGVLFEGNGKISF